MVGEVDFGRVATGCEECGRRERVRVRAGELVFVNAFVRGGVCCGEEPDLALELGGEEGEGVEYLRGGGGFHCFELWISFLPGW